MPVHIDNKHRKGMSLLICVYIFKEAMINYAVSSWSTPFSVIKTFSNCNKTGRPLHFQWYKWCFTSQSTTMVISGRPNIFPLQAWLSGKPVSCAYTFACREELQWPQKLFHDRSQRKYGTRPGLNSGPLDLQVRHATNCAMWPGPGYKTI